MSARGSGHFYFGMTLSNPKTFFKGTSVQAIFGKTVGYGEGSIEVLFQDIAHTKTRGHEGFYRSSRIDGFE